MPRTHTASSCTYQRDGDGSVTFQSADGSVEATIRRERIIGLLPPPAEAKEHMLFYAYKQDGSSAEDEPKECPQLGILALTQPPPGLEDDFGIDRATAWWAGDVSLDIVVSTKSGYCQAEPCWETLLRPLLDDLAVRYNVHTTASAETVKTLAKTHFLPKAQRGEAQKIVLLSGDGGIVDLLNGILDNLDGERPAGYRKPVVALLPLGTGNALANTCGITADATCGMHTLVHGSALLLPYFEARFSAAAPFDPDAESATGFSLKRMHGAVVLSWGLHAALVADSDTPAYRKYGAERFKMAAQENLFPPDGTPPHPYRGRLLLDKAAGSGLEQVERGTHAYVLATLVAQLDKGFLVSPETKPLDPVLRVLHFDMPQPESAEKQPGHKVMEIMMGAYDGGKHIQHESIDYGAVKTVRIEFNEDDQRWRRVCVDGKIVIVEKGGWVDVSLAEDFAHGAPGVLDFVIVK